MAANTTKTAQTARTSAVEARLQAAIAKAVAERLAAVKRA